MSLLDVYTTEELMEIRPCAFDSVDKIIMSDDTISEYDDEGPEMEELVQANLAGLCRETV